MLIRTNTRARFGAKECDGRPGVPVNCHLLPSSPAMYHFSPNHPLEFDGKLIGALPMSLFGTHFVSEFCYDDYLKTSIGVVRPHGVPFRGDFHSRWLVFYSMRVKWVV